MRALPRSDRACGDGVWFVVVRACFVLCPLFWCLFSLPPFGVVSPCPLFGVVIGDKGQEAQTKCSHHSRCECTYLALAT